MYTVEIYSKNWKTQRGQNGTLVRTLASPTRISIEQRLNNPNRITFRVPREITDDVDALEIGRVVVVKDGSTIIANGVLTGPLDKTRQLIPVTVFSFEEILNWAITPELFELESATAVGQVRELLKNYRFFRQTTEDEFDAGTYDTNTEKLAIANSENPADDGVFIILTEDSSGDYEASGTYLSQPLLCTDAALGDPDEITRLRSRSLLGNDTEITAAFRYANTAAATTPSSSDFSSWSSEYDLSSMGGERLGITGYSISADFRWVQVRFTLSTTDNEFTPALEAFEIVCEYPSEITEGTINLDGAALDRYFNFDPHQKALQEIVNSLRC